MNAVDSTSAKFMSWAAASRGLFREESIAAVRVGNGFIRRDKC